MIDGLAGRFADARGYLNTASYGLPPDTAMTAFAEATERWRIGRAQPADYDDGITAARAAFAALLHVPTSWVAVGPQASPFIGLVAAALPDGAEVVVAAGQFTSTLFPFLVQQPRGVSVREVPFDEVANAVTASTSLIAVEAVRSADGAVADFAAIRAAARDCDARVLLDTTQATGWLDLDASPFDYVVCSAYKWLLSPRGTAFMAVRPEAAEGLLPHAAGWYAGADVWTSIYGSPLRLADDARRFDISPGWLAWVATLPAIELIAAIGAGRIGAHDLALANRLRSHLGLEAAASPIVSVAADGAAERLAAAGLIAATRAGAARISFHLYNDEADADRAAEALA